MAEQPVTDYHFIDALPNPSQGENAHALLYEIVDCLRLLIEQGQPSRIDLGALPIGEEDYELLRNNLGEGPIQAEVADDGYVLVMETGIGGVWWLQELSDEEELVAEYLEVNLLPEALQVPPELIIDGRDALQARLFQLGLGERKRKNDDGPPTATAGS